MDTTEQMEKALQHAAASRTDDAEKLCRQVLAVESDNPDAHYVLAIVENSRGHQRESLALLNRAIEFEPAAFWYHFAKGELLRQMGDLAGAIESFEGTLKLKPDAVHASRARAILLAQVGRVNESLDEFRRCIALEPNHSATHLAMGQVLESANAVDAACDCYEKSAALDPKDADSRQRIAQIRARIGEMDQAYKFWREAIALAPAWPLPHEFLAQNLNYDSRLSAQQIFDEHLNWATRHAEPITQSIASMSFPNSRDPDRRLRVGYISADFRNHPIAAFLRPILEKHHRDQIQAVCFSDVRKPNVYTDELRTFADEWHITLGKSDEEVAKIVREKEIDILIDLTGHLRDNRLLAFARRPAPVQISYLGYCNTTGLSAIDWIIVDDITDPPDSSQPYTENILRLPHGFSCYAPNSRAEMPNDLPATRNGYITFASFHRPKKLGDAELDLYARILAEIPQSKILFWRDILFGRAQTQLREKLRERGVTDDRFVIRRDRPTTETHLGMYHEVDISLDAQPWSGHTTACESMWMGVPYVTMLGKSHAGRMAASAVTHAAAGEFIARDCAQFVSIVKSLASDCARLADVRRLLRDRMRRSDLCNAVQFTGEFEQSLRVAWRRWCDQRPSRK